MSQHIDAARTAPVDPLTSDPEGVIARLVAEMPPPQPSRAARVVQLFRASRESDALAEGYRRSIRGGAR